MNSAWKGILAGMAAFAALALLSLPVVMGGLPGVLARPRSYRQVPVVYAHARRASWLGGGFGWMGVPALFSGLLELGLLILLVLGIAWLARAITRRAAKRA